MQLLGKMVWWLGWPFWLVYFRIYNQRTRVLLVIDGEVLLVKGTIGDGKWSLPGGGAHKHEAIEQAAVREVAEETGITISTKQLHPLGDFIHSQAGLGYHVHCFLVRLDKRPEVRRRKNEIRTANWFAKQELVNLDLNPDAATALSRFSDQI